MPHIQLSDETLNRLKALAEPFVDREPEDVIRRLLDKNDRETCSPTPFTSIGGPMTDMASTNPMERIARAAVSASLASAANSARASASGVSNRAKAHCSPGVQGTS